MVRRPPDATRTDTLFPYPPLFRPQGERTYAFPETLLGTDSHTPMINCLGILGWGVGGIEGGSAMLGQPVSMTVPRVVGCHLAGRLRPGVTATDLVLTIVERLRAHGVVGRFVESFGPGLRPLSQSEERRVGKECVRPLRI